MLLGNKCVFIFRIPERETKVGMLFLGGFFIPRFLAPGILESHTIYIYSKNQVNIL